MAQATMPVDLTRTTQLPPLVSFRSLVREYREHLPIWFVYLSGIGLLHAALANFPQDGFDALGIPRWHFVPTLILPWIWFVAYFVLRIRSSPRIESPWKAYAGLFALTVIVPAAIVTGYRPYPLSHDQLTLLFEATQFLWVALFVGQILLARGWRSLVTYFGVTFIYGLLLENSGIVMRFFYEPSFRLYLGPLPAPLVTMLGWSLVFYIMVAVTDRIAEYVPWLKRGVWRRAWAATLMALCMDGQLDPLASMSGVFWRWNEILPPAFLGVPAINFAAWFGAFLPYAYFLFKIRERKELSENERNWELFLRVPLATLLAGMLCFGVMAVIEGGFDGPSFAILRAFGQKLVPY